MIECLIGYYLLCITLVYALLLVTLCGCHFVELLVFLIFQFLVYGLWSTFKFGVTLISIYVFIYIYVYIYLFMSMLYVFVLHFMQELYTNIDVLVLLLFLFLFLLFFNAMMYVYACSLGFAYLFD